MRDESDLSAIVSPSESPRPTEQSSGELQVLNVEVFPAAAVPRVGILVLTGDSDFFATVSRAAEPYRAARVDDARQALGLLATGDWGVIVADTADMRRTGFAEQVHRRVPAAVLIMAGSRSDGIALLDRQAEGRIYRFMLKPVLPGQARLYLESALHHHLELRRDGVPLRGRPARRWLAIGALAAGLALVAAGLGWRYVPAPPPVEPQTPTQTVDTQTDSLLGQAGRLAAAGDEDLAAAAYRRVLELQPDHADARAGLRGLADAALARAEQALIDNRFEDALAAVARARGFQPDHERLNFFDAQLDRERERRLLARTQTALDAGRLDDAVDTVLAVLATGPERSAVPSPQMQQLGFGLLLDLAERLLLAGEAERAVALVEQVRLLAPEDPRLERAEQALAAEHRRRIDAALAAAAAGNFDVARRSVTAAAAIPNGDAAVRRRALANIEALRQQRGQPEGPGDSAAARTSQVVALLAETRRGLADGRLPGNDQEVLERLAELEALSPERSEPAELRSELVGIFASRARAALRDDLLSVAERWLERAEAYDAEQVKELRTQIDRRLAQLQSARVIPAAELEMLSYVPPRYPGLAARRRTEGWVDIEFTVGLDGLPRDISVVGGERQEYFTAATLEAVQQWRFRPRLFRGQLIEQRVSARIRFENQ